MPRRPAPARKPAAATDRGAAGRRSAALRAALAPAAPCPCGLAASYGDCCGALHAGRADAPTAERLMRSRYSAFAVQDAGYLLRTWAAAHRPSGVDFDPDLTWTGLTVLGSTAGSAFHSEGTVEFEARYRLGGEDGSQRENSRFAREGGRWVYVAALA